MEIAGAKNPQRRDEQGPSLSLPDRIVAGTLFVALLGAAAFGLSSKVNHGQSRDRVKTVPDNITSLKDNHLPQIPK